MTTTAKDFPFDECAQAAKGFFEDGATVFQKWTCEGCGERVTANNPNTFTTFGRHEEKADGSPCGHVTNIKARGWTAVWWAAATAHHAAINPGSRNKEG